MSGAKKDLPWKEAITRVLDDAAAAMHYADIAEAIDEQGLRKKVGATPASTVAANLTTEIRQLGEHSAFIRVKTGEYMLRKHYDKDYSPEASADTELQSAGETPGKEAGIIQAFGMYWRRNLFIGPTAPSCWDSKVAGPRSWISRGRWESIYFTMAERPSTWAAALVVRSANAYSSTLTIV